MTVATSIRYCKRFTSAFAFCLAIPAAFGTQSVLAGEGGLRTETLSFLEKPLAVEIGDTTLRLRGSVDQAAHSDLRAEDVIARTRGSLEFSAETLLENQWTVGVSYSAHYDSDPGNITDVGGDRRDENYTDDVAVFVSGVWGRLRLGNVTETVDEETTRKQAVGNAALAFEGALGTLSEWGVAYSGRYGPAVATAAVDEDAGVAAGLRLSRPLGDKDFGLAVRGTLGTFVARDETVTFDTAGVSATADVIYGSSLFDLTVGYENFSAGRLDANRYYVSAGMQHKTGAVTLSASGHYGRLDGNEEVSAAIGGRYDIARGLSANAGLNYARLKASIGGVEFADKDDLETSVSMRYDF